MTGQTPTDHQTNGCSRTGGVVLVAAALTVGPFVTSRTGDS